MLLYESKLNNKIIDEAFLFYKLDDKYKRQAYDCLKEVLESDSLKNSFLNLYKILFIENSDEFRNLWRIQDIKLLLGTKVNPFITNLMILLGVSIHKKNMKIYNFDRQQVSIHKYRVKECFIYDLEKREYKGIRFSQLLWATYFMNCRIIEAGILQYEFDSKIDKIKIHIPRLSKLDFDKVKQSLNVSKEEIQKYFHIKNKRYICNSWLLSKQLAQLLDEKSNIKKFQTLFSVDNGENCINDILNHVFNLRTCDDYKQLSENTSLQRKIKHELMNGTIFKLGYGILL